MRILMGQSLIYKIVIISKLDFFPPLEASPLISSSNVPCPVCPDKKLLLPKWDPAVSVSLPRYPPIFFFFALPMIGIMISNDVKFLNSCKSLAYKAHTLTVALYVYYHHQAKGKIATRVRVAALNYIHTVAALHILLERCHIYCFIIVYCYRANLV